MANVFETVRAQREYTKYVEGVESLTGLVETLSGQGPFTLFAPKRNVIHGSLQLRSQARGARTWGLS